MRGLVGRGIVLFIGVTTLSCSVNILESLADKTTNQALFNEAKDQINNGNYTGALTTLDSITGAFATNRAVVALKAEAHAGLCGLRFLPFVAALEGLATTRLFPLLMSHFRAGTTTATIDSCIQAEDLVESIGSVSARTTDENLLLVLISFAKIGNVLSYYADTDQDGMVTAGYDVCAAGGGTRTAGGDMDDDDVREVGTGLTLAMANLTAIGSSVSLAGDAVEDMTAVCEELEDLAPAFNFCTVTDPADFTANHLLAIRSLLKEDSAVGLDPLGAGCNGDITVCECFP